jgi:hypothetical protein
MLSKALALDSSVDGLSIPPTEFRGTTLEVWDLEKSSGSRHRASSVDGRAIRN